MKFGNKNDDNVKFIHGSMDAIKQYSSRRMSPSSRWIPSRSFPSSKLSKVFVISINFVAKQIFKFNAGHTNRLCHLHKSLNPLRNRNRQRHSFQGKKLLKVEGEFFLCIFILRYYSCLLFTHFLPFPPSALIVMCKGEHKFGPSQVMKAYGGVGTQLRSFLTSVPNEVQWSTSPVNCFTNGARYHHIYWIGGLTGPREEKNLLPLPGIELWIPDYPAHNLVTAKTDLSLLQILLCMKLKLPTLHLFYPQDGATKYTELPSVSVKRPEYEATSSSLYTRVVPKVMRNFFFCMRTGNSRRRRVQW